jgi:hypothetical protein
MRRLVYLFVVSLVLCASASAQPEGVSGTWKHYFLEQRRTVYLELGKRTIIVWSVGDDGSCMQYPGGAEWNGNSMRRLGRDWQVRVDASALQVAFPDTTVTYERSAEDPRELCRREDI